MSEIVFFDGHFKRGNISYLAFKVRRGMQEQRVEVPIDERIANHIMLHLSKVAPPTPKPVERGNDEESL